MPKQLIFTVLTLLTISIFLYSVSKYIRFIRNAKKAYPVKDIWKRIIMTLRVALFQTKILRFPVIGFIHALVFWGFLVITVGSTEMIIDGVTGSERVFSSWRIIYDIITASGDLYGLIVLIAIVIFIIRRIFLHIKRFYGIEMKKAYKLDAYIALLLILLLMVSLLGMNISYLALTDKTHIIGSYPVSNFIVKTLHATSLQLSTINYQLSTIYEVNWWSHILLIYIFANYLPYSKHFHVFMSVPNVFFSSLDPPGKLPNMESVTREVKLMLNPQYTIPDTHYLIPTDAAPSRFGVKDIEDGTWKNFIDSLSCTQCGRCTFVCPANITGKKLSPRKIFIDYRARFNELHKLTNSPTHNFLRGYVSEEELWACTTCNACAQECPVNINHPTLIVDARRYLVMEEGSAPANLKTMFSNLENNGAPWQFSAQDRLLWAKDLFNNYGGEQVKVEVPVMSEQFAKGEKPEYLFWVGCAGAFDDRYKKVAGAFAKILSHLNISYAVLGTEESCNGDPARRAGNEMLFQMQALTNIDILKRYEVQKILTICPHCYNTMKNEYPDLDGKFEVIHYTQFFRHLIKEGKLHVDSGILRDKKITFHDPCYLGRGNGEYDAPRSILNSFGSNKIEMKRNKSFGLCCGAGGSQMWKEAEKGDKEVFIERIEEALDTKADIVASSCPFCMTMLTDGLKYKNKEEEIFNYDIIELVAQTLEL
jgi:Fe-S oxidoreductase/nitrate reductase gamma subunit